MLFWIVVGALAVVQGLIVLSALRMRLAPHALKGPLGARPMELVWTLVPTLILVAIAVLSFQALQDDDKSRSDLNGFGAVPVVAHPVSDRPVSDLMEAPSP